MKDYILNLDKPRRLKFGFKASRLMREQFGGKDLDAVKDMNVDEFPKIAWCGLVWEDEALTMERVEELLDEKIPSEYTITSVIELIGNAIMDHMGVDLRKLRKKTDVKKKKRKQPTRAIPSKRHEKPPTKSV